MNNTKLNTQIIFMGVFVFSVFIYVSVTNIFINNSSDSYFTTENSQINASIKSTTYKNGKLFVVVTGETYKGCIKSTKTIPDINSNCWVEINNNEFFTSVLKNKTYYIWLMDKDGIISNIYKYTAK